MSVFFDEKIVSNSQAISAPPSHVDTSNLPASKETAPTDPPSRSSSSSSSASPTTPKPQERWNFPRSNVCRTLSVFHSFVILGLNDAAYGALVPYLQTYYSINYAVVSLGFICPVIGYFLSAISNHYIHSHLGQRGIALCAPGLRIIGYTMMSQHSHFAVTVIGSSFAGFANGLEDSAWNAWIGNMHMANEVLGFLHGFYGLGGLLGPLIATAMVTKGGLMWYHFYYVMLGASILSLVTLGPSFWSRNAEVFREAHHAGDETGKGGGMAEALKNRVVWIAAFFLVLYMGVEVAIGGWVVEFMLVVRKVDNFKAGTSATVYWSGITVGRLILGFVTGRLGEKLAIHIYIILAIGFHLVFWLVPVVPVSFFAVFFVGFLLGPLFPAAIVACSKLMPSRLHVSGIGFAAAVGAAGGGAFPFVIGAVAQAVGVSVFMPIVLALMVGDDLIWAALPGLHRTKKGAGADEENLAPTMEGVQLKKWIRDRLGL